MSWHVCVLLYFYLGGLFEGLILGLGLLNLIKVNLKVDVRFIGLMWYRLNMVSGGSSSGQKDKDVHVSCCVPRHWL